jgi:dipeptidyl aminopeptidase/acylaminoacyl peptidase
MTAAGQLVRRVTTTGRAHQPTWSPNGKRIAFINVLANGHGDIYTVPATGGAITRITHDAATTCGDDRPSWSPLGGAIVYHQLTNTGSGCTHNRILLVTLSSGAERVVAEDGVIDSRDTVSDPDFVADGQHVVYMARCAASGDCATRSLNPMLVDLIGSNRRALSNSDGTEGDDNLREVAAAPDGQSVVVAGHTWTGYAPEYQGTIMWVPGTSSDVLYIDDSVGTITQPDWQPLS